jgi:hypothetical protein
VIVYRMIVCRMIVCRMIVYNRKKVYTVSDLQGVRKKVYIM